MKVYLFLLVLLLSSPALAQAPALFMDETGAAALFGGAVQVAGCHIGVHGPGWSYASQSDGVADPPTGSGTTRGYSGVIAIPSTADGEVHYAQTVSVVDAMSAAFDYDIQIQADSGSADISSLQISITLTASSFAGRELDIEEAATPLLLPVLLGDSFLFDGTTTGMAVDLPAGGGRLSIGLGAPTVLHVQDNRTYGSDAFELRLVLHGSGSVASGESFPLGLTLAVDPQLDVFFEPALVTTDTSGWIAFSLPWDQGPVDGSAVDMSGLLDPPAGQYGFLVASGDGFEFADRPGVPARFWGTDFSGPGNFPVHEEAEAIADRLARFGVNLVRHHHMDNHWGENTSLIAYGDTSQELDEGNLDKLDYFIAQLRSRGIYSYIDLLVSRAAMAGDGVENADQLPAGWKGYAIVAPRLIELQKDYATKLLTHVNPYTGLAYADDPTVVLMELINENDLYTHTIEIEPYRTAFENRWQTWLASEGLPTDTSKDSEAYRRFCFEVQVAFYDDMIVTLRGLGVQIPVTGTNWSRSLALLAANARLDFTDSHVYWDHPQDNYTTFNNRPMAQQNVIFGGTIYASLAYFSVPGRPFFVSEWDHPWPNFYRAEATLWMAATADLQGWDGLAIYTYRHSTGETDSIDGAFETAFDPAYYGLMPAASMLFLRGDVGEDTAGALVRVPDPFSGEFDWGNTTAHHTATPQYRTRTWIEGVEGIPSPGDTTGALVLAPGDSALSADAMSASDAGGQLTHDWSAGTVIIDTARSQGSLGFIGGIDVDAADVAIRVETPPFAVVMVTSLDGQPIALAGRLLVSAVARAENTGQSYERSVRWTKVDEGDGPTLAEPVVGSVTFPARDGTYEAWALDPLGQHTTAAPLSGTVLELGSGSATSLWYEVVFQPSTADPGEDVLIPDGETGGEEGQEVEPERPDGGAETQGEGEGCGCAVVM